MRRISFLFLITFVFFLLELVFAEFFGRWFKPNLLLLLVVYFSLSWGIRQGLFVACVAGVLKDSMSAGVFGIHFFSFVLCAYAVAAINKYFYRPDTSSARLLVTFGITVLYALVNYFLVSLFQSVNFFAAFRFVMFSEIILTTLLAAFIFKRVRRCVLRLSV